MRRREAQRVWADQTREEAVGPWVDNSPAELGREIAKETGTVYHPTERDYDRKPPRVNETVFDPKRGTFGRRPLDPAENERYLRDIGSAEDVVIPDATTVSDEEWTAARNRRIEQQFARFLYGVRHNEKPVKKEE